MTHSSHFDSTLDPDLPILSDLTHCLTDPYLIWLIHLLMLTQQLTDTYSARLLMIH